MFEWAAIKNGVYGGLFEYFCSTKVTRIFVRRAADREGVESGRPGGELPGKVEANGRGPGSDR